jgi:hypothetical protein
MKKPKGKILNHGAGLGVSGAGDIDTRADENARIEGHSAVTGEDRVRANQEFAGDDLPPLTDDDAQGISSLSRDPSEPASEPGHQVPNQETEDEEFAAERLVTEGVNEADYDQMLAARKRRRGEISN